MMMKVRCRRKEGRSRVNVGVGEGKDVVVGREGSM
jgi:hypothetical protein